MVSSTLGKHPWKATVRLVLLVGGSGIALILAGLIEKEPALLAVGAVLILFLLVTFPRRARFEPLILEQPAPPERGPAVRPVAATEIADTIDQSDVRGLVGQMLAQNRYALLLRPQIAANLEPSQFTRALETLQEHMALVPDGEVTVGPVDEASDEAYSAEDEARFPNRRTVRVNRFFLDRYPVTNREYFEFVAAGGYHQMSLWDESILPAVLEFVDQTGEPGPRFWKQGCYLEGTENHPVVGVSWHEAVAYARWVGKRLPSDAEWIKAGAWPVPLANQGRMQRRYPWGDDMDRRRANVWGSGRGEVTSVDDFAEGVSVGGVYQLIGNVWEWTSGNFTGGDHPMGQLTFKTPMKSIRGGAFDTYFDSQATCQFQSGERTLARKRNIGFRLAIGVCDLVLDHSAVRPANDVEEPVDRDAEYDESFVESPENEAGGPQTPPDEQPAHEETNQSEEVRA